MKNRNLLPAVILQVMTAVPAFCQNVAVTDKSGGITPASQLQVHKETAATSSLIQMTNQSTGATATDGVKAGIDATQNAFITNQETGGTVYIGTSTDNTTIEADGTLKFNGNATVWDDLQTPASAAGAQGSNVPDWVAFRGSNLKTWAFADNNVNSEDELFFTLQLPHSWKEGSMVVPHFHIAAETAPAANQNVVFKLEYVWANVNEAYPTSTSTLTCTAPITTSDDHRHMIASFGNLAPDATTDKISSVLVCRLYRNSSNAADTYTGRVFLISLDLHYEKDTEGSRTATSKN